MRKWALGGNTLRVTQLSHSTAEFPSQVCLLQQKNQPCTQWSLLATGVMVLSQTCKNMLWQQKGGDFSDSLEWKIFYSWGKIFSLFSWGKIQPPKNRKRTARVEGEMPAWLSTQAVISRSISSQQSEWNDSSETWKEKCVWHPVIKGPCVPWQGN